MEMFGIRWAPLYVPARVHFSTIFAGLWFVTLAFGGFGGALFALFLVVYTPLWWAVALYVLWTFTMDFRTPERDGRPIEFLRNLYVWRYLRDYFPLRLERVPWCELEPHRNYLFCSYPHGILPIGSFASFATTTTGVREMFPHHMPLVTMLTQHFRMPFFREMAMTLGACASSARCIEYNLNRPGGGRILVLMPGGVAESYNCQPGVYRIVLRKRKGFIKIALKTGAPIVPVFSFGETSLFTQYQGDTVRIYQERIRKVVGLAPVLINGRGIFQYTFGLIPKQASVTTVGKYPFKSIVQSAGFNPMIVGRPIEVTKTEKPTQDQIDKLHQTFMDELTNLFEEQKHFYVENADQIQLEII